MVGWSGGQAEDRSQPIRYLIKGRTYTAADPGLQDALARVCDSPERPRCLCVFGKDGLYKPGEVDMLKVATLKFVNTLVGQDLKAQPTKSR